MTENVTRRTIDRREKDKREREYETYTSLSSLYLWNACRSSWSIADLKYQLSGGLKQRQLLHG